MEAVISDLLNRFEKGALTRRQLVQGLALLAAGESTVSAQEAPALKATKIDHISIQVTNLPRAVEFYQKIFGLTIGGEDKPNEIVRLGAGKGTLVSLHHKAPTGIFDHIAISVENFNKDKVTEILKARGIATAENLDYGFHIKDPEGMNIQIMPG